MELWVGCTLFAAFVQNLRSLLQKRISGRLGPDSASYVRFCYALPFALAYLLILAFFQDLPSINLGFLLWGGIGAIGQIIGAMALLRAFERRSFGVATAYSKTEVAQTAVAASLFLPDPMSPGLLFGIAISFVGVLLLSDGSGVRALLRIDAGALLGLLSGLGLAVAAVGFRASALALGETTPAPVAAAMALVLALLVQTVVMGGWLARRGELAEVGRAWRPGLAIGLAGMLASAGWFTAMALTAAANVRALGQVELVFSVLTSVLLFGERIRRQQLFGIALVALGVVVLLLLQ